MGPVQMAETYAVLTFSLNFISNVVSLFEDMYDLLGHIFQVLKLLAKKFKYQYFLANLGKSWTISSEQYQAEP